MVRIFLATLAALVVVMLTGAEAEARGGGKGGGSHAHRSSGSSATRHVTKPRKPRATTLHVHLPSSRAAKTTTSTSRSTAASRQAPETAPTDQTAAGTPPVAQRPGAAPTVDCTRPDRLPPDLLATCLPAKTR